MQEDSIAIILARGGSKRVPRKNIRPFCGKPMISWVISAAHKSCLFSRVIISTEDEEIAVIAKSCGAERPFKRPELLADDYSTTVDVLRHAMHSLAGSKALPPYACCLYGTSAFVTTDVLRRARACLTGSQVEWVFAVSEFPHPVDRSIHIGERGLANYAWPDRVAWRTQDCPKAYYDLGMFYFFKTSIMLDDKAADVNQLKKHAIILPKNSAIDIDNEEDWFLAESIFRSRERLI